MTRFLHFLRRHWGKWFLLMVIAAVTVAVIAVPSVQGRASTLWDTTLVWAGLETDAEESGTIYWCPMHPQIKRHSENEVCPICNMALVPLEGGDAGPPEALSLTAQQVQQAGVVTEPVVRRKLYREIDTTGRIVSDEGRRAMITSWVQGKSRIEKLHIDFTGVEVEKGALMAELYSPELIVTQQEYLATVDGPRVSGANLSDSARQRLLYQGMTAEQVEQLKRSGEVLDRIPIRAPISGTVFELKVQEGQYVSEGDVLLRIAKLDHVWLFADIYEEELQGVKLGQPVKMEVKSFPGETFEGEVAFIDPMVQSESRTVRVRVEIPNPDRRLKPGMYARVRLRDDTPELLAVPENAILWSGKRQVAIVKQGEGTFQPREVAIGKKWLYTGEPSGRSESQLEFGANYVRYHEVLSGLNPGDQVVTAGAFLLSAESQFQSVLTKMLPPADRAATLEQAVGEALAHDIRKLLEAYYDLSKLLADDRFKPIPAALEATAEAAASLVRQAEQEDMEKLASAARSLATKAGDATRRPPPDLDEARVDFGKISRDMVRLLANHGGLTLFGEELFLFRCGMSGVGYENWLWWSEEMLNPYMGQKMLSCGTQLDRLEP